MQYVVKNGQDIYSVAVLLYGDAQYAVKLCTDNDITITDSIDGLTLTYDDKIKRAVASAAIKQQNTPKQPDNSYYIKQTQSIWDLILQFGYGLNNAVEFVTMAGLDISSNDIGGQNIQVTKIPNNIPLSTIFATQAPSESPIELSYLLLEDGFYLLQEDGSKFIL